MKNTLITLTGSAALITALYFALPSNSIAQEAEKGQQATKASSKYLSFNSKGDMLQPNGYREWIYVGTPVTPNDMNSGKAAFPEFHNVYIDPISYKQYAKTGKFPDGTILVKELVSVGSKAAVSGKGYFMGDFIGLEVTIKDSVRHPKEPGHWAYYSFSNEGKEYKKEATAFPTASCNACHQASAADDWVFTQYYPVLRSAKMKAK